MPRRTRFQCWGKNNHGQLGRGIVTDAEFTPASVVTVTADEIAAGAYHSCARASTGDVVCWGNPEGSLTPADDKGTPRAILGVAGVIQLALGAVHSCVRASSGVVACWGRNDFGQVGDGSTVLKTEPTPVTF